MHKLFITLALVVATINVSSARSSYKKKLPNGDQTIGGSTALGHSNDSGGGARNAFGQAFSKAGLKWTKELCEADTDGDGQSNGLELGDPNCCFVEGGTPAFTEDLSHPGKSSSKTSRTAGEKKDCPSSATSLLSTFMTRFSALVSSILLFSLL